MTLLRPYDEPQAAHAPQHDSPQKDVSRKSSALRRRIVSALVAVIGLLIWSSLVAPQAGMLAPRFASLSLTTARWLGSSASILRSDQPSGMALGSVAAPQACSSQSASAIGANLVVPAGAWVCGDALAIGGNVTVQGHVQGTVEAIGGGVVVNGEVDGDITAVGGDITVQPGGHTRGKLDSIGGHVIIAPGAIADRPAPTLNQTWYGGHATPTSFHLLAPEASSFWLGLLFWVSAAIGLTAFVPEAVGHVRYTIARRFLLSGFSGAVIALVGVVLGVALFLTCLGIPVTLVIAVAMWLAWVIGTVAFGSWLGASLLRGGRHDRQPSLLLSALIGVILLSLLKAIPVVGPVVSLIVGCVAVGATTLTLLSARRVSYARLGW